QHCKERDGSENNACSNDEDDRWAYEAKYVGGRLGLLLWPTFTRLQRICIQFLLLIVRPQILFVRDAAGFATGTPVCGLEEYGSVKSHTKCRTNAAVQYSTATNVPATSPMD